MLAGGLCVLLFGDGAGMATGYGDDLLLELLPLLMESVGSASSSDIVELSFHSPVCSGIAEGVAGSWLIMI